MTRITSELNGKTVASVRYYWDDQAGAKAGWYVMTYSADGQELDDSMKIWFPVDVDDFSQDEEGEMVEALKGQFPGLEIVNAEST